MTEKLNPSQPQIYYNEGSSIMPTPNNLWGFYEQLGVVNRGVNMLVDASSQIDIIVEEETLAQDFPPVRGVKRARVIKLLNSEPNPFQDISTFRRLLFTDLIVEGNAFIYFDGLHIYHLPADLVEILTDEKTYVSGYRLNATTFKPDEVIHVKDNAVRGIYRGSSRLRAAQVSMSLLYRMVKYQDRFFENGAIPGLILKSPNALSDKLKERMIEGWLSAYSPNNGGKRPLILDGGMELDRLTNTSFKELDFETSIITQEHAIMKTLGVPPVLLDGGNNANIRPNQRLFYIETVIPLVDKFIRAYERFFGFKLIPDNDIPGLQPELQDQAAFYSTLVNTGIITVNEARKGLAYEVMENEDELRIPANIAGSAVDASVGGRPPESNNAQ